jgi:SAM-dependent methyltransferase
MYNYLFIKRIVIGMAVLLVLAPAAQAQQQQQYFDVPFVPTPYVVIEEMLRLANVTPQDYVMDLGSGDGRVLITAAQRYGANGMGVDLDGDLVAQSMASAAEAGVADRVSFLQQDLFKTDLSRATVITMYLLPDVNLLLRPRLQQLRPGTRLVSHDWDMGDWEPDRTVLVDAPDKIVGLRKQSRLMLWTVGGPQSARPMR